MEAEKSIRYTGAPNSRNPGMYKNKTRLPAALLLSVMFLIIAGCSQHEEAQPAGPAEQAVAVDESESWDTFVERYIEEHLAAHPQFAVMQGRHEFDGQLPDWSRSGIEAEIDRLHAARGAALAFSGNEMTAMQQYQREMLLHRKPIG